MDVIRSRGGQGVQEVRFDSVPDILFELGGYSWILSVKIGEDPRMMKDSFLQYLRHKEESKIGFGMLLLLPESIRQVQASESALRIAVGQENVSALIDAGDVKEEIRDRPFSGLVDFLIHEVVVRISKRQATYYPLRSVICLLQQQVAEMMEQISIDETALLSIITDRNLLSDLGHLSQAHAEAVARFLGSYIFLSQILFLRLLCTSSPDVVSIGKPATHSSLRHAFSQIQEINYRPIYGLDVLDSIDRQYLRDTFDLIWGLEVERARYELPGRIFHELMPSEIRKMLAAFYTRPHAADLLATLTLSSSGQTLFDPACGSGTILTSGYRQKLRLLKEEGKVGNPHKRFCENEILGADIMPFAVHLTSANLAAMDPGTIIERTQIIQADSLSLRHANYTPGISPTLFPEAPRGRTKEDQVYDVQLKPVDVVLMNPPFTKVERGIRQFVDMETFQARCGGEVGLWGHFVFLADAFLKQAGTYGAVIPINLLRGRESSKVRSFLFENWTTLYILKPTRNYGFSEWSEYRDILFIAQKRKPVKNHKVKFCLVKKDLTKLTEREIAVIAEKVKSEEKSREDELVDIDSFDTTEIKRHFDNMMWFCGVTELTHRDKIVDFASRFEGKLGYFPEHYFREGYRPVPKGVSKFLFLTRHSHDSRVEQAFLRFTTESESHVSTHSPLGATYEIPRSDLIPTLRTSVGLTQMDITDKWDYIAHQVYGSLRRVCRAAGQEEPHREFWRRVESELSAVRTHLVVSHRINPFSPSTYLNAFFSDISISPSNQLNVIVEKNVDRAKAVCALLNSIIFFAQFFLLKEESTGRYINIRFYDLAQMPLYPPDSLVGLLSRVFNDIRNRNFPALRCQFDQNFDQRYEEFWEKDRGNQQKRMFRVLGKPVEPSAVRLDLDLKVCNAIGINVKEEDLIKVYEVLVKEMIVIRRLTRD